MEWISVGNRLPHHEECAYLVTDGEIVDVYTWKNFMNPAKKYKWYWNDRDEFFDMNVTHWMPLPHPPQHN